MPPVTLIAAVDDEMGLSRGALIPWNHAADLRMFRRTTEASTLLMGRGTYESMRHVDWTSTDRVPVVITSRDIEGVTCVRTYTEALEKAFEAVERPVFVVGGERLYKEAIVHPDTTGLLLTLIPGVHACTTFFPTIPTRHYVEVDREPMDELTLVRYVRAHHGWRMGLPESYHVTRGERAYLALVQEALQAPWAPNRTGVRTRSLLGRSLTFDLRDGFPLLTTKHMKLDVIADELAWFLRGVPDARLLNSRIWEGNTSEAFLRSRGLSYREGDGGPIYPFQWRHFGAPYEGCDRASEAKGVDQITRLLHFLRTSPESRQHVVCAWNPADVDKMALPPCHFAFQVIVKNNHASMVVYQRSADLGLGVPFNIASYALLLTLIARDTGLVPDTLTLHFGDAHVYETHEGALREQLMRAPHRPPTLVLEPCDVLGFRPEMARLENYVSHPPVRMAMVV